jgi:hypothetical protein
MRHIEVFLRIQCALLLAGAALSTSACRTHRNDNFSAQSPIYSKNAPTHLIVGRSGDFIITPEHSIVVGDADFVRDLFSTLNRPATNSFQHYLLIAPYPFVFVDAQGDVCQGFRYSASSRPDCVFWPCWVERRSDDYVVTAQRSPEGIIVPGFTERFRTYMDLMRP